MLFLILCVLSVTANDGDQAIATCCRKGVGVGNQKGPCSHTPPPPL